MAKAAGNKWRAIEPPAVLLTKGAQTNVLTMGYVELNQRDSFWTSWLHVKLWPEIDLAILR